MWSQWLADGPERQSTLTAFPSPPTVTQEHESLPGHELFSTRFQRECEMENYRCAIHKTAHV